MPSNSILEGYKYQPPQWNFSSASSPENCFSSSFFNPTKTPSLEIFCNSPSIFFTHHNTNLPLLLTLSNPINKHRPLNSSSNPRTNKRSEVEEGERFEKRYRTFFFFSSSEVIRVAPVGDLYSTFISNRSIRCRLGLDSLVDS